MEPIEKEIGEAAGKIWEVLNGSEAMSQSKLAKLTNLSTASVNQGSGWLAREGKRVREKKNRSEVIRLME